MEQKFDISSFLGGDGQCPVCRLVFSSRTRLIAHASEGRVRGSRAVTCRDIFAAGLVQPLRQPALDALAEQDRMSRRCAAKRGHTHSLNERPFKRRKVATTVPPLRFDLCSGYHEYAEGPSNCANPVDWAAIRPTRRLRSKASLDVVVLATVQSPPPPSLPQ